MHWAQGAERARVVPPATKLFGPQLCSGCPAITPCSLLRAGKLRLRQTDVPDLERSARLPTQKWVRGVERRGDLTTVTLTV